jgi:hypothetical protein
MASVLTFVATLRPTGPVQLLAQDDGTLLLGEDFLPWIVLALGAAMVVGNVLALVRPPASGPGGTGPAASGGAAGREKPPVVRAGIMIVIGAVAAIWGLASLVS